MRNETTRMNAHQHRHVAATRAAMAQVHLRACFNSVKALGEMRGLAVDSLQVFEDGGDTTSFSITAGYQGKDYCGRADNSVTEAFKDLLRDAGLPEEETEGDNE